MRYALPNYEKYPLETMSDVVRAEEYFLKYAEDKGFPPEVKREYCKNLAQRQIELGNKLHEKVAEYAGNSIEKSGIIRALKERKHLVGSEEEMSKLASDLKECRNTDDVLSSFIKFDRRHRIDLKWGQDIEDPVATLLKTAAKIPKPKLYEEGPYFTDRESIENLKYNKPRLTGLGFTAAWVNKFCKSPIKTFESSSKEERSMIIRLANDVKNNVFDMTL